MWRRRWQSSRCYSSKALSHSIHSRGYIFLLPTVSKSRIVYIPTCSMWPIGPHYDETSIHIYSMCIHLMAPYFDGVQSMLMSGRSHFSLQLSAMIFSLSQHVSPCCAFFMGLVHSLFFITCFPCCMLMAWSKRYVRIAHICVMNGPTGMSLYFAVQ